MRALPFGKEGVSGLLIVTNFLGDSGLRIGIAGFATTDFFTGAAFAGRAFCARVTLACLTCLTGADLATFFADFVATAFFAAAFLTTTLRVATFGTFAAAFFGVAAFVDFFASAAGFAFGDGFALVAALRAPTLVRAGADADLARLLVFCLI
ncbi:MAG: hypothetical protein ABI082_06540 [Dokdonella sp.]